MGTAGDIETAEPLPRSVSPVRVRGETPDRVAVALRPVPASAGLARRFVGSTLRSWDLEELVETATLLVSELVTNAILHARSDVTVTVVAHGDSVRVEVADSDDGTPALRHATGTATTGRGLALVDACAGAWGVEPHPPGKAVWFDLRA